MSHESAAAFAQIIPILFIAAFLSSPRVGSDRTSRIVAGSYAVIGAITEIGLLVALALDLTITPMATGAILSATIYMVAAVVATIFAKLQDDNKQEN